MPATFMLVFVIFVDPCLVKRTKLFRQPSGSDEALARSSYGAATNCSGWARSDRQLPAAECTPRQAIALRTTTRYTMALLQGWAKRSMPTRPFIPRQDFVGTALRAFAHPTIVLITARGFGGHRARALVYSTSLTCCRGDRGAMLTSLRRSNSRCLLDRQA